ncbi:nitrite reductase (NAD(P)H) small subunit [Metabacillus malikii]|uniref:Nitrite reductase (NADH) small subunit n=1 Tax=Metabacillus malikii TaxID=1504265 RepID=A0ABT9ZFD6_9BACI|nr:nitrite reductase (NAD(P)H) small subunit [Metabacillus malikii]MDQ0229970.1 nitrite reductase (NADH) small subunit [Metabacillus malikii]
MTTMKTKIKVATYSELPTGIGQLALVEDEEIVLFKLTNGDVRAIENKSPHPKGGTLTDGLISGNFVYCPVYDIKISLIDGNVQAPDKGLVKVYQVFIEGNDIYLEL